MDTQVQNSERLLDEVNQYLGGESVIYNYQYDSFYHHADIVNRELAAESGWQGRKALDLSELPVSHFNLFDDHIEFIKDGESKFRVFPVDGGLQILDSKDENKSFSILESDENASLHLGKLMQGASEQCCSQENIERVRLETHGGYQLIYGLKIKDTHIFGVDDINDNIMSKIFALYEGEKVKFTSVSKLQDACEKFISDHKKLGPEPVFPQIEYVMYNGRDVKTERMFQIERKGNAAQYDIDFDLIRQLREKGMAVRSEFENKVGIADEHRNFQFNRVLTPSLGVREDALFLTNSCGRNAYNFITAAAGKVELYRQYNVSLELSQHDRTFSGVDEAMRYVRDIVLHPVNIESARQEYVSFCQSLEKNMGGPKIG